MSDTLIEIINRLSLSDLQQEHEKLLNTVQTKARTVEVATMELENAQSALRLVSLAIQMREGPEALTERGTSFATPIAMGRISRSLTPFSFHLDDAFSSSPNAVPTNGEGPDKTAAMLETLRRSNGMRPAQLYKSILAQGVSVNRSYVFTVLQRLKKRGLVSVDDEGRYFVLTRTKVHKVSELTEKEIDEFAEAEQLSGAG